MNDFEPYELQFDNNKRKKMLGEALAHLRKSLRLSQKEVAAKLGLNYTTYNGYENGFNEPNIETIVRMSFLFNCSTDILLQRNNLTGTKEDMDIVLASYTEQIEDFKNKALSSGNTDFMQIASMIQVLIDKMNEISPNI